MGIVLYSFNYFICLLWRYHIILSVLLFSLMCIIVGANSHEEDLKNYAYKLVEEYDNYEDLELLYNNLLIKIDNLNEEDIFYEQRLKDYTKKKVIYEYLLDDYISYDKIIFEGITDDAGFHVFSFNTQILSYNSLIVLLLIIIINYAIFSSDFDFGHYKYSYNKNNRFKLVINKLLLTILVVLAYCLLSFIIISIFTYVSFYYTDLMLVGIVHNKVVAYNLIQYAIANYASFLFFSITMALFICGLFYITKRTIFAILLFALYLILITLGNMIVTNPIILSFSLIPIFSYFENTLIYTIIFNILLGFIFVSTGTIKIIRSDL